MELFFYDFGVRELDVPRRSLRIAQWYQGRGGLGPGSNTQYLGGSVRAGDRLLWYPRNWTAESWSVLRDMANGGSFSLPCGEAQGSAGPMHLEK